MTPLKREIPDHTPPPFAHGTTADAATTRPRSGGTRSSATSPRAGRHRHRSTTCRHVRRRQHHRERGRDPRHAGRLPARDPPLALHLARGREEQVPPPPEATGDGEGRKEGWRLLGGAASSPPVSPWGGSDAGAYLCLLFSSPLFFMLQ